MNSGSALPVPQVVGSYAAFLHVRTRTAPEVTVIGDGAEVTVTVEDRTLALAFQRQRREWSLCGAEVRCGEQAVAFSRGDLVSAIAALLATLAVAGKPSGVSEPRASGVGNAGKDHRNLPRLDH